MVEAIGVAGSIVALLQLTSSISTVVHSYIRGAIQANKDRDALLDELNSLSRVLILLQDDIRDNGSQSSALQQLGSADGLLQRCAVELEGLKLQLRTRNGSKGIMDRLKWPLKEGETKKHIEKIERFKSAINTALGFDNRTLLKEIKADAKDTNLAMKDNGSLFETQSRSMSFAIQDIWAQTSPSGKRNAILDWLYPGDYNAKHSEIKNRRQNDTGKWLLRAPEFVGWVKGQQKSRLLWGHGIPGAGKTFLSSTVISYFETMPLLKFGLAYVYFDYKEQGKQMPAQVLSSLVKQLASQLPELPEFIEELHQRLGPSEKRPDLGELYNILITSSRLFDQVFIIFDALDECDPESQRRALLPVFQQMEKDGINVFLTSRPHPQDIKDCLQDAVKIELSAQQEDIEIYIRNRINENPRARGLIEQGKCRDRIISELVTCAEGMFLLVHFHIEYLCQQTTANQILKALENLKRSFVGEKSLYSTYEKAMGRILMQPENSKDLALRTLSWLVKAKRVLRTDEIRTAVSIEADRYELDNMDLPDAETLLDVCGGLVIRDEHTDTIRLAHYTVQEYLQEYLLENRAPPEAELALACTTYLSFDIFAEPVSRDFLRDRFFENPFFRYASQMLVVHLKACDQELSTGFLLRFLEKSGNVASYNETQRTWRDGDHEGRSPLHIASGVGHLEVLQRLIDKGAEISARDYRGRLPLHVAASEGQEAVVKLLLRAGNQKMAMDAGCLGFTALHEAAAQGHEGVVSVLLKKRLYLPWVRIHARNDHGDTALHVAAKRGHVSVVKLLLEKGAEASAMNNKGQTALHSAIERGFDAVVKLLLEKGAGLSAMGYQKRTLLELVVGRGSEVMIKLLLDKGLLTMGCWRNVALHFAAIRGSEAMINLLLEKGADISAIDDSGKTALHLAAQNGHATVVKLLLDRDAETSAIDDKEQTPLHLAAKQGSEVVVKLLLDKGAKLSAVDRRKRTALHFAAKRGFEALVKIMLNGGAEASPIDDRSRTPLHFAAQQGSEVMAQLLLDKGAELSIMDGRKRTALHLAAGRGSEVLVKLLLEKGAKASAQDDQNRTALHFAAAIGSEVMVKLLLDKGAEASAIDDRPLTALHFAAERGSEVMVKLLLDKGAAVSAVNDLKQTPLHLAAGQGSVAVVDLLIGKGAEVSAVDSRKETALHLAAKLGSEAMVKLLLDKGAEVSAADNRRQTALHLAAEHGSKVLVKMLLDKGAEASTIGYRNRTALHFAAVRGSEEMVKLLLEKGAKASAMDDSGQTALHLAVINRFEPVVKLLLEKLKGTQVSAVDEWKKSALHWAAERKSETMAKLLLDKGADVSIIDDKKRTPLHLAAEWRSAAVIKLLLDKGADVLAVDVQNRTPLHLAAQSGSEIGVQLLLEKGAEASAIDNSGRTALHSAAIWGSKVMANLLLDTGADASVVDSSGKIAVDFAEERGSEEVVKLLRDKEPDTPTTSNRKRTAPPKEAPPRAAARYSGAAKLLHKRFISLFSVIIGGKLKNTCRSK